VTLDDWLRDHAFLLPLARVRAQIDAAIAAAAPPSPAPPDWQDYRADFQAGVPLLHSTSAAIDVSSAGPAIVSAIAALGAERSSDPLVDDARALDAWLREDEAAPRRAIDWLLGSDEWSPPHPGLLRSVGWLTLTASLAPLVEAFGAWRAIDPLEHEQHWMRRYCPTCGSLPSMAQLIGVDPGRQRFLWCGGCATKWRYGRTACPFCEAESHKRSSAVVEGEHGLRIDYCDACHAYLKTYAGQGSEAVLLADWTSLHLDIAARDRGWQRMAASLYDFASPAEAAPGSRSDSGSLEASAVG
jgi:FdhE protein